MIIKPKASIELTEVLSSSTKEELLNWYKKKKGREVSNYIEDVSSVKDKLKDWLTLEEADLIIPFNKGKQSLKVLGYRIFLLAQVNPKSKYFNGCWFDVRVKITKIRRRIYECRLSTQALEALKEVDTLNETN